jgi:hypothetical protein
LICRATRHPACRVLAFTAHLDEQLWRAEGERDRLLRKLTDSVGVKGEVGADR